MKKNKNAPVNPWPIPLDGWPRKSRYEFFMENFLFPHTSATSQVDVSNLLRFCKEEKLSVFHVTVHLLCSVFNEIGQFKQRIRSEGPVQWETLHPSYTVLTEDKQFLFCDVGHCPDLKVFHARSVDAAQQVKERGFSSDAGKADNRLFMSCLPWFSFTHLQHPIQSDKTDATPRIAWGKIQAAGQKQVMPLNIQAHHAFVDGLHLGLAFQQVQDKIESL